MIYWRHRTIPFGHDRPDRRYRILPRHVFWVWSNDVIGQLMGSREEPPESTNAVNGDFGLCWTLHTAALHGCIVIDRRLGCLKEPPGSADQYTLVTMHVKTFERFFVKTIKKWLRWFFPRSHQVRLRLHDYLETIFAIKHVIILSFKGELLYWQLTNQAWMNAWTIQTLRW